MFLKKIIKKDRDGKPKYTHYRLCESYRVSGKVRHRTIFNLGSLDDFNERERKQLADRIEDIFTNGKQLLFSNISRKVEDKAHYFYELIVKQGIKSSLHISKTDTQGQLEKEYAEVDINSIETNDVREIGAEWIVQQTMNNLEVGTLLQSLGMSERDIKLSFIQWISRTVHPASELATEQWLGRSTGLCELIGVPSHKINRHHLYSISRKLYKHKEVIEKHFTEKTRTLFNLNDKIILYDLTNSYFEGRMLQSKKAEFGRSKEKREDCKIIVLALVTNNQGFIRYSKMYKGNMADCKTLATTISELEHNSISNNLPTVVLDAGIATEDNLDMLKQKGYQYVCVSRSALKDYHLQPGAPCTIVDKSRQIIELKKVHQDKNDDVYLYVKSSAKQKKQASIDEKLSVRFEQQLQYIKESLSKKRGIKTIEKVYERIGRLKSKYPRVANAYHITTKHNEGKVGQLTWNKKKSAKSSNEKGIYFIRTSYADNTQEEMIWNVYNCIREIESSFRCLKTELSIRPNYHQKDENIESHIHLGLLAYQVVSVIRYQLKQAGINESWTTLLEKMNTQKILTTSFLDKQNRKVHVRNCSIPTNELKQIQQILKLKPVPFYRKKVVVPQH